MERATHSTSTGYRWDNLSAYLACTVTVVSRRTSKCSGLPRQVWHQSGLKGCLACKELEPSTYSWVHTVFELECPIPNRYWNDFIQIWIPKFDYSKNYVFRRNSKNRVLRMHSNSDIQKIEFFEYTRIVIFEICGLFEPKALRIFEICIAHTTVGAPLLCASYHAPLKVIAPPNILIRKQNWLWRAKQNRNSKWN